MGKNIAIAFVSVFTGFKTDVYTYQKGGESKSVSGMLTNEAPIKYLLREYPKIDGARMDEILCLTSTKTLEVPVWNPDRIKNVTEEEFHRLTGDQSPFDYLASRINAFVKECGIPSVTVTKIEYNEAEDDYFSITIIPEILKRISEDDTVYLETTGGFRINVTQMMLLTRILTYQGTQLACAVYSDFQKKKTFDVTDSYRDFDLVNGLNEFGSTGATGMLESYFKEAFASSPTARELVQAMKALNETIILGRIARIQERQKAVEQKLEAAKGELQQEGSNPLLAVLLPIFENKYNQLRNTPEIIKWCAANHMIQLAFTLYSDWLPHFIMEEAKIITFAGTLRDDDWEKICTQKINPSAYKLKTFFICQATWEKSTGDGYVRVLKNLPSLIEGSKRGKGLFRYKNGMNADDLCPILEDYVYAKTIRNELNHALSNEADSATVTKDDQWEQDRKAYLRNKNYQFDENKLDVETLRQFLIDAMDRLLELAQR